MVVPKVRDLTRMEHGLRESQTGSSVKETTNVGVGRLENDG